MTDPLHEAIQIFAGLNFVVMGASHIVAHRAWQTFFADLHARGATGNFVNAMLALGMGTLIVGFHRVWSGVPVLLTIYGVASTAKGALFLMAPKVGLSSIERAATKDSRLFVVPGVILLALGTALLLGVARG